MEKAARCFAVRETMLLATSRAESAERSSVIPDGKANTAQNVSSVGATTNTYISSENYVRVIRAVMVVSCIKLFTPVRKCSLQLAFK